MMILLLYCLDGIQIKTDYFNKYKNLDRTNQEKIWSVEWQILM